MGDEPILPVIQPVTINTMLNNNGPNIGDGLNFVTCERSLIMAIHFFITSVSRIVNIVQWKLHLSLYQTTV